MADEVPDSQRETIKRSGAEGPPSPADLGERFPQLEILELLGRGGMGYVYKARQPALDRLVALKLLPPEIAGETGFAERFGREARALARLSHPAIVTVHDSGQVEGQYYFVMEYVDGVNLRQALHAADGRMEPTEAMRIVSAVCDALDYAHEEGVVHRDIKPENILLDGRGRVKIADFGLAKLLVANGDSPSYLTLTQPRQVMGTPHYMAPEQTERPLEVDHRADIYSLGVVFYEMLTGELPLGRFPLPSEIGRGDSALDEIVAKALAKDPTRRFQRASEVGTAVASALGSGAAAGVSATPTAARPAAPSTPGTTTRSRLGDPVTIALQRVRPPGMMMLLAGLGAVSIDSIWALVAMIRLASEITVANALLAAVACFGTVTALFLVRAAIAMRRLESRRMALVASIVALVPYHVCWVPVGLCVGIWSLVTLLSRDVVAGFREAEEQRATAVG
jgi:predicted Ser/Thr protein kinase